MESTIFTFKAIFNSIKFVKKPIFIFLGLLITLTISCGNDDENKSNNSNLINTNWAAKEPLNISGIDTTVEVMLSFLEDNKGVIDVSIPIHRLNITGRYKFNYTYSEVDKHGEVSNIVLSFVKVNGQAADSSVTSSITTALKNYSSQFSIEGYKMHFEDDDEQTVFIKK